MRVSAKYEQNKKQISERKALHYRENKQARSERSANYYAENRERLSEKHRQHYAENPEIYAALSSKRRAIKRGAGGSYKASDVSSILDSQRSKCASCLKKLSSGYHVDHIMPLARGGTNDKYNLQILCPSCNLSKHAKDPIDWAQKNGRLL